MAKVAAFTLDGYELVVYPKDHEPEHFHLSELGESWEIKVLFMLCTATHLETRPTRPAHWPVNYHPLPKRSVRRLLELIQKHQSALKAQWDQLRGK